MALLIATPDFAEGTHYKIRQVSSGRFLDAHETEADDWSVVTRPDQNNDTQRWLFTDVSLEGFASGCLRQLSSGRFLDAWPDEAHEWSVVTRTAQNNSSQRWLLIGFVLMFATNPFGTRVVQNSQYVASPFAQQSMFMDAHEGKAHDWSVVNRTHQSDDTQEWRFDVVGFIYEIRQTSSGRFLDAHGAAARRAFGPTRDWSAITRPVQNNNTQRWIVMPEVGGSWSIRQLAITRRFLDAHGDEAHDWSAVTRDKQNNPTQRWEIQEA